MTEKSGDGIHRNYSDDAPKRNPWEEDRLGFTPFAKRLANVIRHLLAPNGYVIGLHGVWGSGKTTVLNFVEAFLNKYRDEGDDRSIQLIHFRPWIISGHQDLVAAFFKVLGETLDPEGEHKKWRNRRLGTRAKAGVTPLINAIATIGTVAEPTGITAIASKLSSVSFDKLFDLWLSEPSLQSAHETLKAALIERGNRFLVVIDDIDRLQRDEIRAIMRLVKSVGQLPNVIYLLAYDRHVVWGALDEGLPTGPDRPGFAEKIVQQEVELPVPSQQAVLRMFEEEANFLLSAVTSDGLRWYHLTQHGIHQWLRQPRDMLRLTNALKFCAPALIDEVDPHDVLAMEGLRLFERPVFDWIRQNRDYLFSEGVFRIADDARLSEHGRHFRESLAEDVRKGITAIVCDLFPHRAGFIGQQAHFGESHAQLVSRRGVGTPLGYDAYFSLFPSPAGIPKVMIDEVIRRLDDKSWLTTTIDRYVQKNDSPENHFIVELLNEISARLAEPGGVAPTQALLDALLSTGEAILSIEPGTAQFFRLEASWLNLITKILRAWGPEFAGRHLLEALASSTSAAVWADIYVDRGRKLGVLPGSNSGKEELLSDADFKMFGTRLRVFIQDAAKNRSLNMAPVYYRIITAWNHLAGPEPVRAWIEDGINAGPQFLATLSHGLLSSSENSAGPQYPMRECPEPELFELELLRDAARRYLDEGTYSGDDERRIKALLLGVETYLAGKTPTD